MPLTPFHIAAGILPKAVAPRYFDLWTFTAVQVALDLEPTYRIFTHVAPVHGPLHSWPGALAVGAVIAIAAWTFGRELLPALVGAMVGAASHVLLDAYSVQHFWQSHWLTLGFALVGGVLLCAKNRGEGHEKHRP